MSIFRIDFQYIMFIQKNITEKTGINNKLIFKILQSYNKVIDLKNNHSI